MAYFRLAPRAAFILLVVLLVGCAGRSLMPTPNLYTSATEQPFRQLAPLLKTMQVNLLYVTDRAAERNEQGALSYGYGRSPSAAFGSAVVQIGQNITWQELEAESKKAKRQRRLRVNLKSVEELGRFPATPFPFVADQGQVQDDPDTVRKFQEAEQQFLAELKRRFALTPRKDVFIYVHGYNNTFADGADTLAELWHFMGREGVALLYSWPAGRGGLTGYGYDRESGQFTVFHFKQLLQTLGSFGEVENVHILAHSRGTDVVTTALRELFIEARAARQDPLGRYRIANLVLAAPDLDMEVLSQRIIAERVGTGVGQLTIYTSKGDKAIDLAEGVFGSVLRLGRVTDDTVPPEAVPLLKEATNLSFVELQGKTNLIGHNYFYSNPASSSDLILVLRYQRQPGAENGRPLRPLGVQIWGVTDDYLLAQ